MSAGTGPAAAGSRLVDRGFSDVDGSGQVAEHAAYLERVAHGMVDARTRWLAALDLAAGEIVLDAGSGLGEVTLEAGRRVGPSGRAVGIDLSGELVARARTRARGVPNVEYRTGDVVALPFGDGSFDAVYSERVLLHVVDPQAAMQELHRVLRPGGRLLVVDPDHSRAATDADDGELADLLVSRLVRAAANPRSGRHLRSQALLAGFVDVSCEAVARSVTDRDEARGTVVQPVEDRVAALVAEGLISRSRADAFLADQDRREREGRFQVTTLWFVLTARKAAGPTNG